MIPSQSHRLRAVLVITVTMAVKSRVLMAVSEASLAPQQSMIAHSALLASFAVRCCDYLCNFLIELQRCCVLFVRSQRLRAQVRPFVVLVTCFVPWESGNHSLLVKVIIQLVLWVCVPMWHSALRAHTVLEMVFLICAPLARMVTWTARQTQRVRVIAKMVWCVRRVPHHHLADRVLLVSIASLVCHIHAQLALSTLMWAPPTPASALHVHLVDLTIEQALGMRQCACHVRHLKAVTLGLPHVGLV